MSVSSVSSVSQSAYTGNVAATNAKSEAVAADKSAVKQAESAGVVYEPSDPKARPTGNAIVKMSKEERANLVSQLKADQEQRQMQLTQLVQDMFSKQGKALGQADDMWKFLAKGDFTVDAATKAQAQADIAEDGYWGVKQTSERIFDFAMALSGGDESKMKEMQKAFDKGFKMATKTWGQELPEISQNTYDAVNKKFEDYYASLQTSEAQA